MFKFIMSVLAAFGMWGLLCVFWPGGNQEWISIFSFGFSARFILAMCTFTVGMMA